MQNETVDRRKLRSKKAIHAALIALMSVKDVGKINVTELMAQADLSRKTFYLHYEAVSDVLTEIESDIVGGLREIIAEYEFYSRPFSTYIFFQCIHSIIGGDDALYRNFVIAQGYSFLTVKVKSVMKEFILYAGVSGSDEKRSAAAEFIAAGIAAMYIDWYENGSSFPLEELSRIADSLLSGGLLPAYT